MLYLCRYPLRALLTFHLGGSLSHAFLWFLTNIQSLRFCCCWVFFFSFLEAGCGAYLCNLEQQTVGSQNGLFWRRSLKVHSAQPFAVCRDTFHWTPLLRAPSKVALNISKFRASSTTLCILFQYFTILTLVCLSFLVRVETLWFCGNFGAVPAVPG